jgi:hypothetical protein
MVGVLVVVQVVACVVGVLGVFVSRGRLALKTATAPCAARLQVSPAAVV